MKCRRTYSKRSLTVPPRSSQFYHIASHTQSCRFLIFLDTFSSQAREIRWEMDLHIHTLWNTVSRDHEERRARTSAALGSVATTTKLPYTHEPILCANVVEGDYLRPCISTLSDDQTTKIFVPAYWSAVKCCTFFFLHFSLFWFKTVKLFLKSERKKVFFTEDQIKNNKNKSIIISELDIII